MKRYVMKPAREGLIVRDPISMAILKAEGELKPANQYWLRRFRDGDVDCKELEAKKKAKAAAKKKEAAAKPPSGKKKTEPAKTGGKK